MKYIVFHSPKMKKVFPVIFPSFMIHSDVSEHVKHLMAFHHNDSQVSPISAGELNLAGQEICCTGESETLGLESRGDIDDQLISMFNYTHGVIDPFFEGL